MDNKEQVYVFFDWSGSNIELGKSRLLRNMCRNIRDVPIFYPEYPEGQFTYRMFSISADINELDVSQDGDVPAVKAKGILSLKKLSVFIKEEYKKNNLSKKECMRVLLLSDGCFSNNEIEDFNLALKELERVIIYSIAVGIDARIDRLKKISRKVFYPHNILLALEYLANTSVEIVSLPNSVSEVIDVFDSII